MIFGFGKKEPVRPLTKFVKDNYGSDEFLKKNRKNNADVVTVLHLALSLGVMEGEKLKKDRTYRSIFKNTNIDIIASEFALFAIRQTILTMRQSESDDDFDLEKDVLSELLMQVSEMLKGLGGSFYDGFESWYSNRASKYTKSPQEASENLAFNLAVVTGMDNFIDLGNKSDPDLKSQIQILTLATIFQKTMVPAYIESIKALIALDL